jgi:TolB-like protein/cytochrome c-type biogenesis protein CcmH/NrfG
MKNQLLGGGRAIEELSPRQREIVELLARGLTNQDIAAALGISATTVRTHVSTVLTQLDITNRTEAAALFTRWQASVPRVGEVLRRPAIAVLPFVVLDGRARAVNMAGGIAHDLAALFARGTWFPVIASASTAGRRVAGASSRDIGQQLGARFVVDGQLRMDSSAFRLVVRIDDVETGFCIWTERYEIPHEALFRVEDEICVAIVAAAYPVLVARTQAGLGHGPRPNDVTGWELAHEGMRLQAAREATTTDEARARFEEAIARAPDLVLAWYGLGLTSYDGVLNQWCGPGAARDRLLASAERCVALAPHAAEGHYLLARYHQTLGDHGSAVVVLETAVASNPSFAPAHALLAQTLQIIGRDDEAIQRMDHAARLSPRAFVAGLANFHFIRGEYPEALQAAERTVASNPHYPFAHVIAAASAFWLGDRERAAGHLSTLRRVHPSFVPERFLETFGAQVDAVGRVTRALSQLGR